MQGPVDGWKDLGVQEAVGGVGVDEDLILHLF